MFMKILYLHDGRSSSIVGTNLQEKVTSISTLEMTVQVLGDFHISEVKGRPEFKKVEAQASENVNEGS